MVAMQDLMDAARAAGELPANHYRVAIATSAETRTRDFDTLASAVRYATDLVSEAGDTPTAAIVLDHRFAVVHRARPYYES